MQAGSYPQITVVDKIRIDTAYNGTALQPDVEIAFTYNFNAVYVRQNPGRWVDPMGQDAAAIAGELIWGGIRIGGQLLGGGAIALGIFLSPTQLGDGTLSQSFIDAQAKISEEECNSSDCTKATKFQLRAAGITDEHAFKTEWVTPPLSRRDICACKNGSIVIRPVGTSGKSGPRLRTH